MLGKDTQEGLSEYVVPTKSSSEIKKLKNSIPEGDNGSDFTSLLK